MPYINRGKGKFIQLMAALWDTFIKTFPHNYEKIFLCNYKKTFLHNYKKIFLQL